MQYNRYWCVDDVEIWAKPSRGRDVSVSEVRWPKGLITQGKPVTPSVFVWNHGRVTESVAVTMTISGGYSSTKGVKQYPYNATLLEFPTWSASPGTYTATCYAVHDSDELRGNDTASLTFRVLADTWVKRYAVYGGGGMHPGACLTTVDSNTIFCVTGRRDFFAKYLVSENLWKNRPPTPVYFHCGAALAYPGGDFVYALRGNGKKEFYRYKLSKDSWYVRAQTPERIGNGGALAWGGGDYLYALRGGNKKDFFRFRLSTNTWDTRAETPDKVGPGGSLVWAGGDFLYALRGDDTKDFYRYQISTNQWTTLAVLPEDVDHGGALVFYPQANKVYAFVGNNSRGFYVYSISGGSWSSRRQAPAPVRRGGCLTFCDYSVFGGVGVGSNDDFWRYSPAVGGFFGEEGPEIPVLPTQLSPAGRQSQWPIVSSQSASEAGPGFGPPEELLTYDPSDKLTPQYSPDGLWIAFTAFDTTSDCYVVRKVPARGGDQELLAEGMSYEDEQWSLDGNWLVAAGDDGLYRLEDGQVNTIATGIIQNPRVASDSWIVYERWDTVSSSHKVHRVRFDGTEDSCLTAGDGEHLEPRPIGADDVVCVRLKDEVYQLCRTNAAGDSWLTSDYMTNTSPKLSSDQEWLTYEKLDESGFWQVYRMRTDGTDEERLTDGTCPCQTPVFSPDGGYVAYTKWPLDSTGSYEYSQVCYVEVGVPNSEVALNEPDAIRQEPCWSPDGAYIVYELETTDHAFGSGMKPKRCRQLGRVRTGIKFSGVAETGRIPRRFELSQNRPNPFVRSTAIRYAVPKASYVELVVYDVTGRVVNRLVQDEQKPAYYTVVWRGEDGRGRRVPAGAYYYMLRADKKLLKKRMLLVR